MSLVAIVEADYFTVPIEPDSPVDEMAPDIRAKYLADLEQQMREYAKQFEFEKAAQVRDKIKAIRSRGLYDESAVSSTGVRGAG
jgi:excinuclease ABC subunit B